MARGRRSPGKRKGKKGGNPFVRPLLYGLVVMAGTFAGIEGYNRYLKPHLPQSASNSAKQASVFTEPAPEHHEPRKPRPARSHPAAPEAHKNTPAANTPAANAPAEPEPAAAEKPARVSPVIAAANAPAANTPAANAPAANVPATAPGREVASSELPRVSVSPGAEPVAPAPMPISPEAGIPNTTQTLNAPKSTGFTPAPIPAPRKPVPVPVQPARPTLPTPSHPVKPIEIDKGSGRRPEVSLTFDAGSDWKPVKKILDALAGQGVKATFFLTGEWVQKNPRTTRLIVEQGHELGNHSWDHPPFTHLTDAQIQDQLRKTDQVIQEVSGRSTRPWFRPPLGDRDRRVRQLVGDEGYFTVYWTLDSRDSVDKGITAQQIRDRVLGKVAPGSIVLMHCGSQATADALPDILQGLRTRGLTTVPVSRLLQGE